MKKFFSAIIIMTALYSLAAIDVTAIPRREGEPAIRDDTDVLDLYPDREPKSAKDFYELGVTYLRRGSFQTASQQFQKALELDPKHVNSLLGLMASALPLGNTEAALEYSSKAVKTEPNSAKIRNDVGEIWMANAQSPEYMDKAEARFKEAVSLDPKFIPPRMNLGRVYISKRQLEDSIREYKDVIKIEPGNMAARRELSTVYLNAGDLDKAMDEVNEVIKALPDDPIARNALGEVYMRKGDIEEALAEFQKAVELGPDYAPGHKNIGVIYLLKGSMDKAIEQYQKALSVAPNYGDGHASLGEAYMFKGMTQEAAEEFEKAIARDSVRTLPLKTLISVYNNLAYIYAEDGQDLDKALLLAEKARQVAPNHPGIADTLGWVYYKKGNYEEAVTNLKVAAEGMPDNPIVRYHLGAAYYKQGTKDEAVGELKKALEINSEFKEAEDARRLLAELEK